MSAVRKGPCTVPAARTAARSVFPGISFASFQDPPGLVRARVVNQTGEFVVVAEGDLEITAGREQAACGPGDLVPVPAGVPHIPVTLEAARSQCLCGYGRFGGGHG